MKTKRWDSIFLILNYFDLKWLFNFPLELFQWCFYFSSPKMSQSLKRLKGLTLVARETAWICIHFHWFLRAIPDRCQGLQGYWPPNALTSQHQLSFYFQIQFPWLSDPINSELSLGETDLSLLLWYVNFANTRALLAQSGILHHFFSHFGWVYSVPFKSHQHDLIIGR